jgi:hypothetical protein
MAPVMMLRKSTPSPYSTPAVEKLYVFVTDEVDGYLFADWFKPDGDGISVWWGVEAGIILKGLTSESDFQWNNVTDALFW